MVLLHAPQHFNAMYSASPHNTKHFIVIVYATLQHTIQLIFVLNVKH